jgi:hypothetical protein
MLTRAVEFGGYCPGGCGGGNDTKARGGVEIGIDVAGRGDELGDHTLCLQCAARLAKRITKAIAQVRAERAKGNAYRHDKWGPRPTPGGHVDLDETFLQECLAEARDGEHVTIEAPRRQWTAMVGKLVKLGATAQEMVRIQFKNAGAPRERMG